MKKKRKSKGKWTKHKLLSREPKLKGFLPETKLLTEKRLDEFLQKYGEVIVKPNRGSLGRGVCKITDKGGGIYEIHGANQKESVEGLTNTYSLILENTGKKKNIIQKVIPLATKDGRPFDVRVMVQRKKNSSEWIVNGMAAKVASNEYFITNAASEVLLVEEAIQKSNIKTSFVKKEKILKELERISILIARALETHYPKCTEMGMDMGIDAEGNVWIIEVNLRPMITMFTLLRDKSILEGIQQFREENK